MKMQPQFSAIILDHERTNQNIKNHYPNLVFKITDKKNQKRFQELIDPRLGTGNDTFATLDTTHSGFMPRALRNYSEVTLDDQIKVLEFLQLAQFNQTERYSKIPRKYSLIDKLITSIFYDIKNKLGHYDDKGLREGSKTDQVDFAKAIVKLSKEFRS